MVDFELAGLTELDTGAGAGVDFAAGAGAGVLAAGAAAGAGAGALLAVVSSAVFFLWDFLVVLAVVSVLAAAWLPVAVLSVAVLPDVLAVSESAAVFFLWDLLVVLAEVSLLAAVWLVVDLSSVAAVSFLDFFDFFLVVVSVLVLVPVSVVLDWAAAMIGANANVNAKQNTADNKPNLLHEFIFLALHE